MKNIYLLPTEQPSRLVIDTIENKLSIQDILHEKTINVLPQNLFITSDEEIKEGDWRYNSISNSVYQKKLDKISFAYEYKIILTTDQNLIKDGVQAIDDKFLEWFVKNPSCEEVEIVFNNRGISGVEKILKSFGEYEIIIPKEQTKQELPIVNGSYGCTIQTNKMEKSAVEWLVAKLKESGIPLLKDEFEFIEQAKEIEKQQKGYSEEDLEKAFKVGFTLGYGSDVEAIDEKDKCFNRWFKIFKNK